MEEYLEKLLLQIRCKKARPYIRKELQDHIEDQQADYLAQGMEEEEALQKAVTDMGDPVAVGISLDKIHKPRIAWKLLLMVGILSLLGILVQWSLGRQFNTYQPDSLTGSLQPALFTGFLSSVVSGFALMCIIYFLDYTVIAKYSKLIGGVILGVCVLYLTGVLMRIVATDGYIGFGMLRIAITSLLLFYVPVYGGILYQYRNGGFLALGKALVWFVIPCLIAFYIPSLTTVCVILISMLIQLSIALHKGWFQVPVKKVLIGIWSVFALLPLCSVPVMMTFHLLAVYQEDRLRVFLSGSTSEQGYLTRIVRECSRGAALVGTNGKDVIGSVPEINSDYIFTYVLSSYGLIAGIAVIAALATLLLFIFAACFRQKNEQGLVMGVGCGMILACNGALNLLGAVGFIPPVSTFLPFFSVGRSNIILSYALVGMILSIYRYKDVYPRHLAPAYISDSLNLGKN